MKETSPTSVASTPSPPSGPERSTKRPLPLIYVAGPYSSSTPWGVHLNVLAAEEAGSYIALHGGMPVIPHKNTEHFQGLRDADFWYEGTLRLAAVCDALYLVKPKLWERSVGTRKECEQAKALKQPIFEDLTSLTWWLDGWRHAS